MDPSGHYADPFGEALSHSYQRVTQLTSLLAAAAEVAIRLNAARAARQAAHDQQARRVLDDQERTAARRPRPAGRPPTTPAGWPRPACSRPPGPGAPPPHGPAPTPPQHRRCAKAKNASAHCTHSRWPATTGSAAREPARSTRCAKQRRCSASTRTRVPPQPARLSPWRHSGCRYAR